MAFLKPSKFLTLSLRLRASIKVLHALFTDFSFPLFCIELMGRWKHGGSDKKKLAKVHAQTSTLTKCQVNRDVEAQQILLDVQDNSFR